MYLEKAGFLLTLFCPNFTKRIITLFNAQMSYENIDVHAEEFTYTSKQQPK